MMAWHSIENLKHAQSCLKQAEKLWYEGDYENEVQYLLSAIQHLEIATILARQEAEIKRKLKVNCCVDCC
jgi:hypothetical protein